MSKEEKSKSKSKGNSAVGVILVIAVIVIIVILALKFGLFGLGTGSGSGDGDGNADVPDRAVSADVDETEDTTAGEETSVEEVTEEETEAPTEQTKLIVQVTVSGKVYLYNNNKYELDELVEELKKLEGDVEIEVFPDDDSSYNAMKNLTKELDDNDMIYQVINANT